MFEVLLPIMAPIFICVGLGWGWVKSGRSMDISAVNTMVTNLGAPCLVFSSLASLSVSPAALTNMALATALAVAVFLAVGAVILRLARLSLPVYLPSLAFTNCGNMGLPLSLFAFGQMGLDLAAAYFAVSMVVMMVLGLWLVSGEPTPKKALTMPLPYAVAAALAFRAAEVEVPAWLYNSTDLLGGMTVPLMLLTLGVSLASMRVVGARRALGLAVLRLAMGVALGVAIAELFAFELDPNGSTITVTELVFSISGISGLVDGDWAGVEIVVDDNDDGNIGGGETTTVGGSGTVSTAGGTITFSTSFDVTAVTSYILRADYSSLSDGDRVTVELAIGNITTTACMSGSARSVSHAEGCQYFESFQSWTASSPDTWQTQSLSGSPYFVPASAIVEIAVRNSNASAQLWGGVRAVGSGLERRFQLQEAEAGGKDIVVMHVQANASSQIQHYSDVTANVDFVLLGYLDAVCGAYV
ncbi:MAG: hypothetical protein IIB67_11825, partial [Proteobacteria bacterium]|nr:hypothetical protein [Pseudomonadota bacterium]